MGSGIFSIGVSGLQVAQLGLLTTEHNITNVNTPGYTRQRAVQAPNIALQTGSGYVGQGTYVATIDRMYSSFLSSQVDRSASNVAELEAFADEISLINNMLADPNAGLSPAMKDFFEGVQKVAADPASLSARQAMLSAAQSMVARFRSLDDRLEQQYEAVNTKISSAVGTINSYAQQIANLNERIVVAQSSTSQPANDLLDQRELLVSELNKLIRVTTSTNTDGSFNVFFGTGQQLVTSTFVSTLVAEPSVADSSRMAVGLQTAGQTLELPDWLITGGSLGGLLSFRTQSLDRASNELGRIATSMALTVNAQHALGQDLFGGISGDANFVADFFNVPTPTVMSNARNPATSPTVTIAYTSPPPFNGNFYTDLTNSDYQLGYDGTNLILTRLTDKKTWTGADVAALNTALAGDPQGFTVSASAAFAVAHTGASYIIQPSKGAARNIAVNTTIAADVRQIAAAAPIRTQQGLTNTGNATISAGMVATGYVSPASGSPVTLTFSGGNLTGFPLVPVSVTANGVTTNYAAGAPVAFANGATVTYSGISFEISGSPANGDTFLIQKNVNGVSDSRNALLMGKLQTQSTMSGQKASYQGVYAQLVGDAGNKGREIEVTMGAQKSLLAQSENARNALSGVNLDEEAANLLRYQQAYQAAAKMIDIGSKLFDSILAIG